MEYDFNSFIVKEWLWNDDYKFYQRIFVDRPRLKCFGDITIYKRTVGYSSYCTYEYLKFNPFYLKDVHTYLIEEAKQLIDSQLTKLHKLKSFL